MKIRLRLALLSILLLAVSLLACGGLLLRTAAKSAIAAVEQSALAELDMLTTSYDRVFADVVNPDHGAAARRSLAEHLFRQYLSGTSRFALVYQGETLFNTCGLDVKKLLDGAGQRTVRLGERRLFLAASEANSAWGQEREIYLVRDMTGTYDRVRSMAVRFAASCMAALLLSAGLISLCTFRALRPLKLLQQSAAAIADGAYDRRVPCNARSHDEIAELAKSFNRMAETVETHIREVSAVAEERKMLLGALTHEIKTPMTAIIGYAEALQRVRLDERQRAEAIDYIHSEGLRLERLTQKMLKFMILSDSEALQLTKTTAAALQSAVEQPARARASQRGAALRFDVSDAVYQLDCDLMASALLNLIDNACTAGASRVCVRLTPDRLIVSDDGCGIPQTLIDRVSEPFFRVDKSRSRRSGNAGLGLALVKRIAKLHHAGLLIESDEGRGTAVSIVFESRDI